MSEPSANIVNVNASNSVLSDIGGNQYNNTITGNQTNIYNSSPAQPERDKLLASLKPADRRNFMPEPCMEGTRRDILAAIDAWAARTDKDVKNIFLLTGSPGSGKSAIASSLVSKWRGERKLGATFAFRHDDVALNNPDALWRSVASDLAHYDQALGDVVVEALQKREVDPTVSNVNPSENSFWLRLT